MHTNLLQQYKQNCTLKQAVSMWQLKVIRPLAEKNATFQSTQGSTALNNTENTYVPM